MYVQNATLKALVQGEKQFRVPIWQRQYTWRVPQHEQLWHDLAEQYEYLAAGGSAVTGHFLGSFVLSPVDPNAAGLQTFLVIDGQQRLTTLMLVLCALRDIAADEDPQAVERFGKLYLFNEFQQGADRYRLQPTEEDRVSFHGRIEQAPDSGARDLISEAYRFYVQRLRELRADRQTIDARLFERVIAVVGVDNLAGLARVDLQRRGHEVTKDDVYAYHQRRLDPISHDEERVEAQVRDLALRARHYKRLIDPSSEPDPELAAGLGRLARWGAQTSHPVLMIAYDLRERGVIETAEIRRVVALVESFIVRRQLARIPTNSLSRAFVQLIERLPEGEGFADALHRELSRDRLYWPDDDAVRDAVKSQPFFHIGRWHQRKMILERLERSLDHPEPVDFDEANLQIEHIMPQTLSPEWREHLQSLGQDADEVHGELVHTLGNLTLTAFNGTLSNNPFERKVEIYGDSHLELNRALQENDVWGRHEILARADSLAQQVSKIWVAPLPGISDERVGGFDWSRVEAAIAAIPVGRWTSYSDLAALGGTAAQPVGNFVTSLPDGSKGYRVLSWDGNVSASFRWTDPRETRDVREVLAAEGVEFQDGRASVDQHITSEELASLIDEEGSDDLSLDEPAVGDL